MAKSLRSKREKRLRSIRREITEPFHEKKDVAKYAATQAAMNAPKLPVRPYTKHDKNPMEITTDTTITNSSMDVEMGDAGNKSLKVIGKKMKKKFKIGRGKKQGQGKVRRKHNI
ncbi:hypothetical protein C5167_039766 [Papaver somniferum]|uniref:Uncharacterized protein n=1 Tax=Papaver somniferum TaxID=3469 RepID=A0A4Y7IHB5_PAPSO|nr:uncharacterized protein LOC113310571 [Papaver somniferum]RZC46819.1 hypothetical protein C5167_039766 [Papaver somniferum]